MLAESVVGSLSAQLSASFVLAELPQCRTTAGTTYYSYGLVLCRVYYNLCTT